MEAEMAKALEGQFFWEYSHKHEPANQDGSRQIRIAQRKFYKPKKMSAEERAEANRKRLAEIADKRLQKVAEERARKSQIGQSEADNFNSMVNLIIDSVADIHGVFARDIMEPGRHADVVIARQHFVWSLLRYISGISLPKVGQTINQHHTTVLHSRDKFEKVKYLYKDKVETMDRIMGYVPG